MNTGLNTSAVIYPPVTVGVVTHNASFVDFASFLKELKPAIAAYPGQCQLIVVNNSGHTALVKTAQQLDESGMNSICQCTPVASPENNIAKGRNEVINNAANPLLAFIDDDEFPSIRWLVELVDAMMQYKCEIVAGPAIPIYLFPTPTWVKQVDLHSARGKTTGQVLRNCPTANVLIDMSNFKDHYFDVDYGRSGGEDTEFFMRLTDSGAQLCWCNEAEVFEYIPRAKSTTRYMIKRSILQGELNRRILTARGDIRSQTLYTIKSIIALSIFFSYGAVLTCVRHKEAGNWVKRGLANIGHLVSTKSKLYPQ